MIKNCNYKKIYIASPYTFGDKEKNVKVQIDAYWFLFKNGFIPIAPLLAHFVHVHYPLNYERCLKIDFELIKICQGVLRLPGKSDGADKEVIFAKHDLSIPVFFSYDELLDYYKLK
jgi:hypothetical protein